jgi:hypothetical protein
LFATVGVALALFVKPGPALPGLAGVEKDGADPVGGYEKLPAILDLLVFVDGPLRVALILGDPAQLVVGDIHVLFQGQQLVQVGLGLARQEMPHSLPD